MYTSHTCPFCSAVINTSGKADEHNSMDLTPFTSHVAGCGYKVVDSGLDDYE